MVQNQNQLHFTVLLLGFYLLQNIFYNVVGGLLLSPTNKWVSYSVSHKYTVGVLQNRGDMICILRVEMADNKISHLRWKRHLGNSHQTEWNQRVRLSCRDYMTALILYFGIKCTADKRDQWSLKYLWKCEDLSAIIYFKVKTIKSNYNTVCL